MRSLTVVAYAVNGAGLGHLTRVLAVLRWMRRIARCAGTRLDAYVLTTSEASDLALREGFAAFKLPSKTAIRDAEIPKEDYLRLARQWIWHSVGLLKPDILLVDTFPGGTFGELGPVLDVPAKKVFIHRAVKDDFARLDGYRAFLPQYDRIIAIEEPSAVPTGLYDGFEWRVRTVGPILLRGCDELHTRADARRRLGIPDGAFAVWVGAGGGGDHTAERTLRSIAGYFSERNDCHLVIGAGPLYRGEPLRDRNITWHTEPLASLDFPGLDAAISAAGFNSFYELLNAGIPSAFFAQEKIADDQLRRIQAAVDVGAALYITADSTGELSDDALDFAMRRLTDDASRTALSEAAVKFVPTNFAREAARLALQVVIDRHELDDAMDLATPGFFKLLDDAKVNPESLERALKWFDGVEGLGGEEMADLFGKVLVGPGDSDRLRWFLMFAKRFPKPTDEHQCEQLVEGWLVIQNALAAFNNPRGTDSFLNGLPLARRIDLEAQTAALETFLRAVHAGGETIYRAQALIDRHHDASLGDRALLVALEKATEEVRDEQRL